MVSEDYDDDMECATTYRPDPATAAQLRELLGVGARTSVRVQRRTVVPDDYNPHVDEVEFTASDQEFRIEDDYSGDAGVKLMETLAFRQAPPVVEQAAALAGARPDGNVVVLRSLPTSDMASVWDRATVQVLGVEDGELLVAPEGPGSFYRDRVPERIPLEKVGVLDRASAVKSRPSLAWSKGYWSTRALDEINEAELLRRQAAARAVPEHDWTSRFEIISSDHEHGFVPDEVKGIYTGEMIGFATYDLITLDPICRGAAGHIGREIGVLDEEPDQAKIAEIAQRMHREASTPPSTSDVSPAGSTRNCLGPPSSSTPATYVPPSPTTSPSPSSTSYSHRQGHSPCTT